MHAHPPFLDRADAGRQLGDRLAGAALRDPLVLALPRGGVPVGFEVAARIGGRLEVFVARKVGAPGHEEYGIGAVAEGGASVVDQAAVHALGISAPRFAQLVERERQEVSRRVEHYRGHRALPDLRHHDVVLVDDGLATGVTAEAALMALAGGEPRRLVLAVPVGAPDTCQRLRSRSDEVICLVSPADLMAVGRWYVDFDQVGDDRVLDLLRRAQGGAPG